MTHAPFEHLSAEDFLRLSHLTGFLIEGDDLGQLARRRLLIPLDLEGAPTYTRLHLYVLSLYDEAVTVRRHPWETRQAERSLDEVSRLARTLDELLRAADAPLRAPNAREAARTLALELTSYVEGIDPFGPLSGVVDLLRDEAMERVQGPGRRYVELLRAARDLADWLESEGIDLEPQKEKGEEAETAGEDADNEAAPAEEATDEPDTVKVEEDDDVQTHHELPPRPAPAMSAADSTLRGYALVRPPGASADQTFELTLDMAIDDEIEEVEAPKPAAPPLPSSPTKKATEPEAKPAPEPEAKPEPVSEPKSEPEAEAEPVSEPKSEPEASPAPDSEPREETAAAEDLATQIEELNRQRERLLAEKDWQGLVDLYEARIGLFETPAERQQVLMTLAALYERKLEQPGPAFRCYRRALDTLAPAGRDKALEGLRRLGALDELRDAYRNWLEARLAGDLDEEERRSAQRDLAFALHDDGEHQRAFLQFAALLAERPDEHVTPQSLDDLEALAAQVDDDELLAFYDDLLDHEPSKAVAEVVAVRAALLFRARSQPLHTLRFFRIALDANPANEVAFNHLLHLYQDEGSHADLVRLYEARIEATDGAERLRLRKRLEEVAATDVELLQALAEERLEAGEWSDALTAIDKLALAGTELPAELQLQWLKRGLDAADKAGREAVRQRLLEQIRRLDPEHETLQ